MPASQPLRRLAAIVFTDIVGYSALVHRDDANALKLVAEHFALVREIATAFDGRVIKTIGDSVHLEFASAQAATECAIAIQQRHRKRNARVREGQRFDIRISVHLGDVEMRDGDMYGDGVNIAARLQPLAPVGGIAISDHVRGQLRQEVRNRFSSRGAQELKNIAMPVEVFVIEPEAIAEILIDIPKPSRAAREPAERKPWFTRRRIVSLGILAFMLWVAKPWQENPKRGIRIETVPAPEKSIAVLPFVNSSGDPANEYFSDGLAEELISTLGRARDLRVIGRTSSFQYKNKLEDSRTIGKALNVSYLVEGSVRKAADRVRIVVSLLEASDGSDLWSKTYDRELKDIFAVQSEIASAVADELELNLLGTEAINQRTDTPPHGNVEAYQEVLQGDFFDQRYTLEDQRTAIGHYARAIELEPEYALAHARLSWVSAQVAARYAGIPPKDLKELSRQAHAHSQRALEIEPQLAAAHVARCTVVGYLDLDFAAAEAACRRAHELAPKDPGVISAYARWRNALGHADDGLALEREAIALDPLSAQAYHAARESLLALGRYDEAEAMVRKQVEQRPEASREHANLASVLILAGRNREALEVAKQEPDEFWRTFSLAQAYDANGDRAASDKELNRLIAENANEGAYQIAQIYGARSDADHTFEWLEKALQTHDSGLSIMAIDPFITRFKDDPRYVAFAKKIGLLK